MFVRDACERVNTSRATARLEMALPGGLKVRVVVFSLLRPAERPKRVYVTRDEFQETRTSTAYLTPEGAVTTDAQLRAIHIKSKAGADRIPRVCVCVRGGGRGGACLMEWPLGRA
jgi:hypothetical protein